MFRKIISLITLAALVLWTSGCSSMIAVSGEEATGDKAPTATVQEPSATELVLNDRTTLVFDSAGAVYTPEDGVFRGRLADGSERRVPVKDVKFATTNAILNCDPHVYVSDIDTYLSTVINRPTVSPLSIDGRVVREVQLRDSTVVKVDKSGLRYDCANSTLVGRTKSGESVSVQPDDIAAYKYKGGNPYAAQLLAGVGITVVLLFIIAAMELDWDYGSSRSRSRW